MKITLNELRKIVKKIIKEEEEKNPKEMLSNEFKTFQENYKNFISIKKTLGEFLNNTDLKNLSNVIDLIKNTFNLFNGLSRKYTELFNELKNASSFSNVVELIKTRLPEILKTTLEANEGLKQIYQISDNEELDKYVRQVQYGIIPFKMAIDRIMGILPRVEASLPPQEKNNVPQQQNNVPQQQSNISQSNTNSQQIADNLKASNSKLQGLFFEFEKAYKLNKNKYINDEISEKQFSAVISNYLQSMSGLASQMKNEINSPVNENSFKISIFEDSDFDNYVASLKKYFNSIDEAISSGKINTIGESIDGIMRISRVFQEDLNTFSR